MSPCYPRAMESGFGRALAPVLRPRLAEHGASVAPSLRPPTDRRDSCCMPGSLRRGWRVVEQPSVDSVAAPAHPRSSLAPVRGDRPRRNHFVSMVEEPDDAARGSCAASSGIPRKPQCLLGVSRRTHARNLRDHDTSRASDVKHCSSPILPRAGGAPFSRCSSRALMSVATMALWR